MSELTQEYLILFRSITQTLKALDELQQSLMAAQQLAEDAYISRSDP